MSLIDDALRRAQEEAERQEEAHRRSQRPWIPPEPPRPRRSRTPLFAAGALLAVAAAVWVAVRPARSGPGPVRRPSPSEPDRVAAPKLETVAVPAPDAPVTLAARPLPAPPPPRAAGATHPESRRPKPSSGLTDGKTFVRTVPLGEGLAIDLDGIVFSDTNPVAVIGGKVLGPGGIVDDFQVVRIEANRVTLRGRGVTIYVSLS